MRLVTMIAVLTTTFMAHAGQVDFNQGKAHMLQDADKKIADMIETKACISKAKGYPETNKCFEVQQARNKAIQATNDAFWKK